MATNMVRIGMEHIENREIKYDPCDLIQQVQCVCVDKVSLGNTQMYTNLTGAKCKRHVLVGVNLAYLMK